MEGFKERLIITLRFIYDVNLIYLLFLLVTTIISLVLFLGHDGKYELLNNWHEIIGLDRDNGTSYIIQIFIVPSYNFLDWLLTGKYQVLPKLITKLIQGRIPLILRSSIMFLVLLYIATLCIGVYITNQEEKAAEKARITKEIQLKKDTEIAMQRAEERRLKEELLEKEKKEKLKKEKLYRTTFPYQGLTCQNFDIEEDIILILKRNNDKTKFEVDLRTRNMVLDGVIYSFETILDQSIKVTEAEININLKHYSYLEDYSLGTDFSREADLILSRSSLKLTYDHSYLDDYQFQCRQVDYESLYDFVRKHNATITDKNKF